MIRALAIGAIVVCVCLAPCRAIAQSSATFTPSLSIGSVYDDNLFARTVGSGDQMTLVSPGIEASFENPRAAFLGFYTFDMQRSFDHPGLNELEARRHALIDSHYRRSEQLSFALIGRYDLTQTAGDLSFNTGLLFDRHQAVRWELNPSFAYQFRPRTSINARPHDGAHHRRDVRVRRYRASHRHASEDSRASFGFSARSATSSMATTHTSSRSCLARLMR
jgi:hypothetical protein